MQDEECRTSDTYRMGPLEVLEMLGTSMDGLDSDEAMSRSKEQGPNEIPRIRKSFLKRVAPQIFDFVIILLIGIAVALAVLAFIFPENESTSFETSVVILAVIMISWILIVIQMYSAERSLESLRKIASAKAAVKRSGSWTELPTSELVTGDIVRIGEGDRVPADIRIIQSDHLSIDESSLTGESISVEKDQHPIDVIDPSLHQITNMAFMSTVVTRGACEGVVSCIGLETELGKIAKGIQEAPEPEIPLQRKMSQLGKTLSVIMLSLILLLLAVQIIRLVASDDLSMDTVIEELINAVILGVVAVPWSFPIITTSVMARGMTYLVKENAIVRKIASIEGLGRVSVICSDKTGTMTQNAMTVKTIFIDGCFLSVKGNGYSPEGSIEDGNGTIMIEDPSYLKKLIEAGFLNNDSKVVQGKDGWNVLGDPTEGALRTLGMKAGIDQDMSELKVLREIPFDSQRKMMSKVIQKGDTSFVYTKGGFEVVLDRCDRIVWGNEVRDLDDGLRECISKANEIVNGKAQRTLAVAYKEMEFSSKKQAAQIEEEEIESGLVMLGFVGMIDPPKDGVREAVRRCSEAGIRVVMITGDSKGTATAIAKDLGIMGENGKVMEGGSLTENDPDIEGVSVFCRVSPQQKVEIVKAYQKRGDIIAMTGDGMNDAAALKNADVGVAMGVSGVDVAKEASQIVLSDDNFATLVTAVHRGRQIFDNIRKSITYQMYTNIGELSLMFLGTLIFSQQLMSDRQLLFLYFSTHLFPVAALVLDKTTPGVMKEPPRRSSEGIISSKVIGNLTVMILSMALISLCIYFTLDRDLIKVGIDGDRLPVIQTMILTFVVWAECFNLFNSLSMKDSLGRQIRERNMILPLLMVSIPLIGLTILMYFGDIGDRLDIVKLTPLQYLLSVLLGAMIIPIVEAYKVYVRWSAGKERRVQSLIMRSWEIGRQNRLNDMPAMFQKELNDFIARKMVRKGLSRIGSGLMNAARDIPGRMGMPRRPGRK